MGCCTWVRGISRKRVMSFAEGPLSENSELGSGFRVKGPEQQIRRVLGIASLFRSSDSSDIG